LAFCVRSEHHIWKVAEHRLAPLHVIRGHQEDNLQIDDFIEVCIVRKRKLI
jgi:hypothetical protein